jgi:hypothetical protein
VFTLSWEEFDELHYCFVDISDNLYCSMVDFASDFDSTWQAETTNYHQKRFK